MLNLKIDLREIFLALRNYLKHPVQEIRKLPTWEWRRLILAQVVVTMFSGLLSGVIHHSLFAIFFNMILTPILSLITAFISSLFFFYTFQIFSEKTVEFRSLFTAVFFANVPFFIFQIVMGYFPPILLVGLAFTAILLIVAFVDNFQLPRKLVSRLIGGIYVIFVLTYLLAWYTTSHSTDHWHQTLEDAPAVQLGNEPKAH